MKKLEEGVKEIMIDGSEVNEEEEKEELVSEKNF